MTQNVSLTPQELLDRIRAAQTLEELDFFGSDEGATRIDLYDLSEPLGVDWRDAPWQLEPDSPHHALRVAFAQKVLRLCEGGGASCERARASLGRSFARFSEYAFDPFDPFAGDRSPINADRVRLAVEYLRQAHRLDPVCAESAMTLAAACTALATRPVCAGSKPTAEERRALLLEGRAVLHALRANRRTRGMPPDCRLHGELQKILTALIEQLVATDAERDGWEVERERCRQVMSSASDRRCVRDILIDRSY